MDHFSSYNSMKLANVQTVLNVLKSINIDSTDEDFLLHQEMKAAFITADIPFQYDYNLGDGNRIDFFVFNRIGISIQTGKKKEKDVLSNLQTYSLFPQFQAIIIVMDQHMFIPKELKGKPCYSLIRHKFIDGR